MEIFGNPRYPQNLDVYELFRLMRPFSPVALSDWNHVPKKPPAGYSWRRTVIVAAYGGLRIREQIQILLTICSRNRPGLVPLRR